MNESNSCCLNTDANSCRWQPESPANKHVASPRTIGAKLREGAVSRGLSGRRQRWLLIVCSWNVSGLTTRADGFSVDAAVRRQDPADYAGVTKSVRLWV